MRVKKILLPKVLLCVAVIALFSPPTLAKVNYKKKSKEHVKKYFDRRNGDPNQKSDIREESPDDRIRQDILEKDLQELPFTEKLNYNKGEIYITNTFFGEKEIAPHPDEEEALVPPPELEPPIIPDPDEDDTYRILIKPQGEVVIPSRSPSISLSIVLS